MIKIEFSNFQKILISIILALVLVILVGTIIALSSKSKNTPEVLIQQGKATSLMAPSDSDEVTYYELGSIRILTKGNADDQTGTLFVVSPWIAYPAGDTVFYEELARKRGLIKGMFQSYFTERTKNEILSETEEKIEIVLKDEINAQLSLGQISDIYFTDYIFLE